MNNKNENLKTMADNPKKISKKKKYSIKLNLNPELKLNFDNLNGPFSKDKSRDVSKSRIKYFTSKEINYPTGNINYTAKNKTPRYQYTDILMNTYACTTRSTKFENCISFKGITPKNKKIFPLTHEDNKIFKLNSFKDNKYKPISLKRDETQNEQDDHLDENDQAIQKLKMEIKTVLTGNNFNRNEENAQIDNFFSKFDNRINFQEDVMQMPNLKNKLYTSGKKKLDDKLIARQNSLQSVSNNFLLSEKIIKKSRQETEKLLISPNFIDHNSNKYITKLKRLVQNEKDFNNNLKKTETNYIKEIIDNRLKLAEAWYNKEFKEYFSLNIMKYRNIGIVDERIKNTILSYNERYDNFKNLKF